MKEIENHAGWETSKLIAQKREHATTEVLIVREQPDGLVGCLNGFNHDARVFAGEIRGCLSKVDGQKVILLPELQQISRETVGDAEIIDGVLEATFVQFLQQWW